MIRQSWAKVVLARPLGAVRYAEISTSATATIILSATARGGARSGATLPRLSVQANTLVLNATARASLGLSLGSVRVGSNVKATLPPLSIVPVSTRLVVSSATATLPMITLGRKAIVEVTLPRLIVAAISSKTVTTTSVGWITNLTLEETTKFTNFGFMNVVRLGNNIYGVKSDGLYLLGATTDNSTAISSYITTHPQNYKQQTYKRIPYMYVQTPYPVSITSYVDSQTVGAATTDHGTQKVVLSKGTQGYYWSFKIANVAPNSFKLDGIEPFIDFMKRRA